MEATDFLHMKELLDICYPKQSQENNLLFSEVSRNSSRSPSPDINTYPIMCCDEMFYSSEDALCHWYLIHLHHLPDKLHCSNTCRNFTVMTDDSISIIQRVTYFLNQIKWFPSNPKCFFPTPHFKHPLQFSDPANTIQAMAYDFLEVVSQRTKGYLRFLSFITDKVPAHLQDHIRFWPFWASYIYPSLMHYNQSKKFKHITVTL